MEKRWWHDAVVYQIYPRSFCDSNGDGIGDLQGIISKLDYLKTLGVNVIWLSPVYQSPMDDNGYDISDYQAIAPEFGTMDDMDQLLAEAKARDIRIVMDLVVNHTSDEHVWFQEARKSRDNPYRDFYIWRDEPPKRGDHNYLESVFGGSAWEFDEQTGQYFLHIFSKRQPDLNWENPKVHQEVYKMMNWWLDRGIGGFRLDVIDLIGKEIEKGITGNGPRLHPMIKDMNRATFGGRDVLTVGETWDVTPETARLYSNPIGDEFSMVFTFDHITLTWNHGNKWEPVDLDLKKFKQVLTRWQVELANEGWNSLFWNNHDLPRVVSKYGDEGELRVQSAQMLATALHFLKGTPYIYQGEEIGMTNVSFETMADYRDIETLNFYKVRTESGVSHDDMMSAIHKNGRDNARTPMQWNDSANAGFTSGEPWIKVNPNYGQINASADMASDHSIFRHYQTLIALRKELDVIVYGDFIPVLEEHDKVFAYLRRDDQQTLLVVNNFSRDRLTIEWPEELRGRSVDSLICNYQPHTQLNNSCTLQPFESFAVRLS